MHMMFHIHHAAIAREGEIGLFTIFKLANNFSYSILKNLQNVFLIQDEQYQNPSIYRWKPMVQSSTRNWRQSVQKIISIRNSKKLTCFITASQGSVPEIIMIQWRAKDVNFQVLTWSGNDSDTYIVSGSLPVSGPKEANNL